MRLILLEDESQLGKGGESATRRSGKTLLKVRGGMGFPSRPEKNRLSRKKKRRCVVARQWSLHMKALELFECHESAERFQRCF